MKNWCGGPWQGLIGLHSGSGGRRKKLEGGHTYIFFLHSSNYDKSLPIDSQHWSLIHLYEMCTIIWKEFASLLHDFQKSIVIWLFLLVYTHHRNIQKCKWHIFLFIFTCQTTNWINVKGMLIVAQNTVSNTQTTDWI
jgi:hypothetical protein